MTTNFDNTTCVQMSEAIDDVCDISILGLNINRNVEKPGDFQTFSVPSVPTANPAENVTETSNKKENANRDRKGFMNRIFDLEDIADLSMFDVVKSKLKVRKANGDVREKRNVPVFLRNDSDVGLRSANEQMKPFSNYELSAFVDLTILSDDGEEFQTSTLKGRKGESRGFDDLPPISSNVTKLQHKTQASVANEVQNENNFDLHKLRAKNSIDTSSTCKLTNNKNFRPKEINDNTSHIINKYLSSGKYESKTTGETSQDIKCIADKNFKKCKKLSLRGQSRELLLEKLNVIDLKPSTSKSTTPTKKFTETSPSFKSARTPKKSSFGQFLSGSANSDDEFVDDWIPPKRKAKMDSTPKISTENNRPRSPVLGKQRKVT